MKVSDAMTIKEALELMRSAHVHRLPVVDADGALEGILTIKDVVMPPDGRSSRGSAESDRAFLTLCEVMKGIDPVRSSHEAVPAAFDEKGRSPLERVFSEPDDD